jgi:Mg2+/Co2+ transporter CorB
LNAILTVLWCVIIAICFLGVLLLNLAEASLLSVSKSRMRSLSWRGDRAARRIVEMTENADFLSVSVVGVNSLVLIIATLMTLVVRNIYGDGARWYEMVAHAATIACILVVAELWPVRWRVCWRG